MSQTNSKPTRDNPLLIHFPANDKERLRKLAERDHRSLSNMAAKLLLDGMGKLEHQLAQSEQST